MIDTKVLGKAVRLVAWANVLFFFNFKVNGWNLLPPFAGWFLMWKALQDLKGAQPKLVLVERFCVVLGVWSAVEWQQFVSMPDWLGPITLVLSLMHIYFDFQLLTELALLARRVPDPKGEGLPGQILGARTAIVVLQTATTLTGIVPVSVLTMGILEYLWTAVLAFLVLFQVAYAMFLMYILFELAGILEKAEAVEAEK